MRISEKHGNLWTTPILKTIIIFRTSSSKIPSQHKYLNLKNIQKLMMGKVERIGNESKKKKKFRKIPSEICETFLIIKS